VVSARSGEVAEADLPVREGAFEAGAD